LIILGSDLVSDYEKHLEIERMLQQKKGQNLTDKLILYEVQDQLLTVVEQML